MNGNRIAALCAVCVVIVTGCGSGARRASSARADTQGAKPSPGLGRDVRALVTAGYRAFWDAMVAAGDPPDPGASGLGAHASGDALAWAQRLLEGNRFGGIARRGTVDLSVEVLSVDGPTATIRDCYQGHWLSYALSANKLGKPAGAQLDEPFPYRQLRTATLVETANTWKVDRIEPPDFDQQRSCGTLAQEKAVTDAYRRYAATVYAVFSKDRPDPNDARLAAVATGPRGLDFIRDTIRDDAAAGVVRRWSTPSAIGQREVLRFEPGRPVLVASCVLDDGTLTARVTGQLRSPPATVRRLVTASVEWVDGAWKVSGTEKGQACTL
jgi:hypothetical protein